MSRVRSRGNRSTELVLVSLLRKHRIYGWRRHSKIAGTPDFVFVNNRVALFVDGCFWHGCPEHAQFPVERAAFWAKKLEENKARDRRVTRELRYNGWRVIRIWQHELKAGNRQACAAKIRRALALQVGNPRMKRLAAR
jgi:DNA mismatch endonuclease (patch repair protein)